MSFNFKWFILDIHGWKTKPETEPDTKPETEPENHGWEIIPNPNPQDPKPADIRPELNPLPSAATGKLAFYSLRPNEYAILTSRGVNHRKFWLKLHEKILTLMRQNKYR
jgi:hypothetical protein